MQRENLTWPFFCTAYFCYETLDYLFTYLREERDKNRINYKTNKLITTELVNQRDRRIIMEIG